MVVENDFVPFCPEDTGTNLLEQADYLTSPFLPIGNQPGVASSQLNNKALRQATAIAAAIAQYMANATGDNVLDNGVQADLLATIAIAFAPNPSGAIVAFGGTATPAGYLFCDGSAVSRTTYANLFAAVGSTWGPGDGSTTFNLPNLQGVFVRGAGSQTIGGIDYTTSLGAQQTDAFQGHVHDVAFTGTPTGGVLASSGSEYPSGNTSVPVSDGTNGTPRTGFETRPANVGMNYIIKT